MAELPDHGLEMPIVFKPGVNFTVIQQIANAVKSIDSLFTGYGFQAVITGANTEDEEIKRNILFHASGSAHYYGAAIDIRTKGLPAKVKSTILSALKKVFTPLPPWFVNLEFPGGLREHIHIQYGVSVKNKTGQIIGFTDGQKIIY